MKNLIRVWLLTILAAWGLYVGLAFLIDVAFGHHFNLLEKGISAAVYVLVVSLGFWIGYSYFLFPRIKYLEKRDTAQPTFENVSTSVVNTPQGFDFGLLKTAIAGNWMVTFSDDVEKVLKFRTKIGFKSWGEAAWLQYDSDTEKLYLACFPIAKTQSGALKIQREIEDCFKVFEPTVK